MEAGWWNAGILFLCFLVAHGVGVRESGVRTARGRSCYLGCSIEQCQTGSFLEMDPFHPTTLSPLTCSG